MTIYEALEHASSRGKAHADTCPCMECDVINTLRNEVLRLQRICTAFEKCTNAEVVRQIYKDDTP